MKVLLAVLVLGFSPVLSLAQGVIYWPEHEGMNSARWSPDGAYIATWGESPLVRIWNDENGSLAFELDHSQLHLSLPNGETNEATESFSIRGVAWSEDLRHIITYAQPDANWLVFYQFFWTADLGIHVYTQFWGVQYYYSGDYRIGHKVVQENEVVASWYRNVMTFSDINPVSESFGDNIAVIDFGDFATFWEVRWNVDMSEALLKLTDDWVGNCDNCEVQFRLYDTDLQSESFAELLWQREAQKDSRAFAWPNAHDLLAIQIDDRLELWDLDQDSKQFGRKLLEFILKGEAFHSALYDDVSSSFVITEIEAVRGHDSSESRLGLLCASIDCWFDIRVFHLDSKSPMHGRVTLEIRQPYKIVVARDGVADDLNHVNLNASKSQIHVHSVEKIPDTWGGLELTLTAYDLATGKTTRAEDIIPRPTGLSPFWIDYPEIDYDTSEYPDSWYSRVVDAHPNQKKIIIKLRPTNRRSADWWLIQDTESREYFLPPEGWRETWAEG